MWVEGRPPPSKGTLSFMGRLSSLWPSSGSVYSPFIQLAFKPPACPQGGYLWAFLCCCCLGLQGLTESHPPTRLHQHPGLCWALSAPSLAPTQLAGPRGVCLASPAWLCGWHLLCRLSLGHSRAREKLSLSLGPAAKASFRILNRQPSVASGFPCPMFLPISSRRSWAFIIAFEGFVSVSHISEDENLQKNNAPLCKASPHPYAAILHSFICPHQPQSGVIATSVKEPTQTRRSTNTSKASSLISSQLWFI